MSAAPVPVYFGRCDPFDPDAVPLGNATTEAGALAVFARRIPFSAARCDRRRDRRTARLVECADLYGVEQPDGSVAYRPPRMAWAVGFQLRR